MKTNLLFSSNYDKYGRTYLFDLDFWYLRPDPPLDKDWRNKYAVDAYHAGNVSQDFLL